MIDYKYAYFIGAFVTLLVWLVLYITRKDLRNEMLVMSFATLLLAPTNILYFGTYWEPQFVFNFYNIGIESIIVCFSYGGICGIIYEYTLEKRLTPEGSLMSAWHIKHPLISFLLGLASIFSLELFTDFNVILTTSTGLLVTGLAYVFYRRDLLIPALITGVLSTLISVIIYWLLLLLFPEFFDMFWVTENIIDIRLLSIPIQEHYFHFALGVCLGPMY